ncbi:MAG: Hsp70 family protein [Deltaproteobacteria bacterium]|nr:Hsp70 family protein [Deltaproteobacteria bacterium]
MNAARYIVGIDLGTTNNVVAYCDTAGPDGTSTKVEVLPIPQLIAAGNIEARPLLPSFLYLPASGELAADALRLPWKASAAGVVGLFAQKRGAEVPSRLIASAKSWLSYAGVDRTAAVLPWGSPDDVPKLSPVDASAQYLAHLRHAWNAAFRAAPLEQQDVLLTVPASFDAVARDLTVRAAHDAGLPQVTVLEEPQAAFYAWIDTLGEAWRKAVTVGDVVLVCDIGGGTTDFSLIAVREERGELVLERVAVGDHILLGGDNMDLALAYAVRDRLARDGTQLDNWQFRGLMLSCREAKEQLLGGGSASKHAVAILGRGRKVIGGTLRAEIDRRETDQTLLEGFFPQCGLEARPQTQRRTALQEIGLPYAADAAVTRHLATFLERNSAALGKAGPLHPTAVLFNGGVMRAAALRDRLVSVISSWYEKEVPVRVLAGGDPENAVARGAAYYGLARRGRGVRIRGGTARSYYIGIETAMPAVPGMRPPIKALCVAPRGIEEGSGVDLPPQEFGLIVGAPAEFRFLSSATRREDQVGSLVESWNDDISELEPLEATVDWKGHEGTTVPVRLQARVTELGVLELWCVSRDGKQRWKLEFNVRGGQ